MKKYWEHIIIGLCIVAFLGLLSIIYFGIKKRESNKLIASCYYANYAWGYVFHGVAIFGDGSIYSWDVGDDFRINNNYSELPYKYSDISDFISKYAKREKMVVSDDDLKQIKKYISSINKKSTQYSRRNEMVDAGEEYVYVYKDNQEYLLDESGDYRGTSSDPNAQKLIELIKKYKSAKTSNNVEEDAVKMIASSYYENYAWGYSFNGVAFFEDGSIYTWNTGDGKTTAKNINYKASEYEDLYKFVIENGQKEATIVSDDDLKQMLQYASQVNENSTKFEKQNVGNDIGSYVIYAYHDKDSYLINENGDFSGTSSDSNAQKLIEIVKKYIK